jgi:hypothetical protein
MTLAASCKKFRKKFRRAATIFRLVHFLISDSGLTRHSPTIPPGASARCFFGGRRSPRLIKAALCRH